MTETQNNPRQPATEGQVDQAEPKAQETAPGSPHPLWRFARYSTVVIVLCLLALLVWSLVRSSSGADFVKQTEQGKMPPAPSFDLPVLWPHTETWPPALTPRLTDGRLTLAELRGQPAVINFWASWCYPCKQEASAFARTAQRYRGQIAFVGIDVQDLKSSARAFLRRYKVNYVSVRDGSDKTYNAYGLTGVPETYFVDRKGRTLAHAIGRMSAHDLMQNVRALLARTKR